MTSSNSDLCPLSAAVSNRQSAFEMLATIREIRDTLLTKTVKGRQLISLYKQCSPTLLKAVFLDRRFRNELLIGLENLQPAIAGVKSSLNGGDNTYVFTQEDAQTITYLVDLTINRIPESQEKLANKLKQSLHFSYMPGKTVKEYLAIVNLL